jgi:hypothetical protein
VKVHPNSQFEILLAHNRESLQLISNKRINFLNENHLFEAMGLTETNEDELEQLFS